MKRRRKIVDEEGEEEREATQKKGQKKKKKTSKPRGAPKGQPIAYETLCFYIDTIEQQIPKVLRKVPSSDRDAADEALREVVERVSEQLNHQLVRPSKRIDYANLADATKRLESAITANTLLLARLTAEVENKQSDLKEEKQRLARLQEEAEKIERKRAILQKKRKLNPTEDLFGEKRDYVHPLLGPDSHLMATSVQLTEVAIDPEQLVETVNQEGESMSTPKGKEKEGEDQDLLEVDVVQGLVDDLAVLAQNRAPLLPLLEDLTATRDRLCAMLAGAGASTGVEPLHFLTPPPPSSSSSSASPS